MPNDQIIDLPVIGRAGSLRAVDETARSFEVLWTTGAQVRRYSWARDEEFDEELVVTPGAMRLERLNSGAPFLNSHASYSLRSILGVVEDGSIRIENGQAFARIRLSERDEVEDIWRDIRAGIIRNVSVGYRVHRFERVAKADRTDGGSRALYRAVDWEPLEISAVAIGADASAGIRSGPGDRETRLHPCTITMRGAPMPQNSPAEADDARNDPATRSADPTPQAPAAPAPANPTPAAPDAETIRAEERRRSADIMALCRRAGFADMADDLIGRGVTIPDAGLVILRDGTPGTPEVTLSPLRWHWQHRAELEVFLRGSDLDNRFDTLTAAVGALLASDRTLGGICDWNEAEAPEPADLPVDGASTIRAAVLFFTLHYTTADPLI